MSAVLEPVEVAPGLSMLSLRTPTLPPATHTNAYLIGTREVVLVEPASPFAPEIAQASAWVEATHAAGKQLCAVLLTHHHPDHVGGAQAIRERFGVPVWAHARTAERLAGRLVIDRHLEDGERIDLDGPTPMQLESMLTPGHAPGHLCFFEPNSRSLIAGDMVAGVGTILVDARDGDMQQYVASLEAMRAREASQLLPAHGLPIADPAARLGFYLQHRREREGKVLAALSTFSRPASLDELLPHAYADTPPAAWPFARLSLEAHLIKLAREERAIARDERWLAVTRVDALT